MKALRVVILILLLWPVVLQAQQSYLRPPGDLPSNGDSTLFPLEAYVKVVSYSFNRDTVAKRKFLEAIKEWDNIPSEYSLRQSELMRTIAKFEEKIMAWGKGIIENNRLVEDAQQIKVLNTSEIDLIRKLISAPLPPPQPQPGVIVEAEPSLNCLHMYRDALVFFNKEDEIVGTIDLCFQCLYNEFSGERKYYLKYSQILHLKSFFKNTLGHPVDLRPY